MSAIPIVRIELEAMRHTIAHAMTSRFAEMDKDVQEALKQAIENFDFRREVRQIAEEAIKFALKDAIERHFRYGGEGFKAVEAVAVEVVKKALKEIPS